MEYNITWLKIPTGSKQTICSWLFCKHGRGFELGTTKNKIPASCRGRTWTWGLQTTSLLSAAFINLWSKEGAVVRALASYQCGPAGSSSSSDTMCEVSLFLPVFPTLRDFSLATPDFPFPLKPTFQISIWFGKCFQLFGDNIIRVQQVYKFFSH